MVVIEIMAINGAIRLSQHLKNQKRLRKEAKVAEGKDDEEDLEFTKEHRLVLMGKSDECSTAGVSISTATTCDSTHDGRPSLQEHFEQLEQAQQDQEQDEENDDCISVCSLTSTIATTSVLHSRFNCSFRPDDSVCFDDMNEEALDSLDLSTHDVYNLTQRARRGGEDDDLEVAIQAAILAQEMAASAPHSRPAQPRIKRPTARIVPATQQESQQRPTVEDAVDPTGPVKNFMLARVDTLARNTRVIDGFVQARVATFTRNVETISMLIKGGCDDEAPAEDIPAPERPCVETNEF